MQIASFAIIHRGTPKQIRRSLHSAVSPLNCYLKFCQLEAADAFPVTERRGLDWGAAFNDAYTIQNYTIHLQKVCFSLGCPKAW